MSASTYHRVTGNMHEHSSGCRIVAHQHDGGGTRHWHSGGVDKPATFDPPEDPAASRVRKIDLTGPDAQELEIVTPGGIIRIAPRQVQVISKLPAVEIEIEPYSEYANMSALMHERATREEVEARGQWHAWNRGSSIDERMTVVLRRDKP